MQRVSIECCTHIFTCLFMKFVDFGDVRCTCIATSLYKMFSSEYIAPVQAKHFQKKEIAAAAAKALAEKDGGASSGKLVMEKSSAGKGKKRTDTASGSKAAAASWYCGMSYVDTREPGGTRLHPSSSPTRVA